MQEAGSLLNNDRESRKQREQTNNEEIQDMVSPRFTGCVAVPSHGQYAASRQCLIGDRMGEGEIDAPTWRRVVIKLWYNTIVCALYFVFCGMGRLAMSWWWDGCREPIPRVFSGAVKYESIWLL